MKTTMTSSSPPPSPDFRLGSRKAAPSMMMNVPPPRPRANSTSSHSTLMGMSPTTSPVNSPRVIARRTSANSVGSSSSLRSRSKSWASTTVSIPMSPRETLDALEKALRKNIRKVGQQHPTTAVLHNHVGNFHFRQGNMELAAASYKLAVQCETGDHLATSYLNLGTVYWRTGEVPQAIKMLEQALAMHEFELFKVQKRLDESLTTASVYHQLGLCQALIRDFKTALLSLDKARSIRVSVLGDTDISVARTVDAMGKVLCMQGKFDEAIKEHQKALSIYHVRGVSNTSSVLQNIANAHQGKGDPWAAVTVMQEVCNFQKAELEAATKAFAIDKETTMRKALFQTLQTMSELYEELGERDRVSRTRHELSQLGHDLGLVDLSDSYSVSSSVSRSSSS